MNNNCLRHVKKYRYAHQYMSYKDCLKNAKKNYKYGGKRKTLKRKTFKRKK